jgi:23S rRNA pseudouridine2457 synthase
MIAHRHFIMYKPYGYLSQFLGDNHRKKYLGELYPFPDGTMAIGRLDEASEGLLLLTTDGRISELVRSRKIEKEYYAQVDGRIDENALEQLRQGVEIGIGSARYRTLPCRAYIPEHVPGFPERRKKIRDDRHGPTSWVALVLHEGKFRQVRKMTAAAGFPTLRLVRVRIGSISLDQLGKTTVQEVSSFF